MSIINTKGISKVSKNKSKNKSRPIIIRRGGEAKLQEKEVTSNGTVTPDTGFDGLSKVTVNVVSVPVYPVGATVQVSADEDPNDMYTGTWVKVEE